MADATLPMAAAPILDIQDERPRPIVKIGGAEYTVRFGGDLTLIPYTTLQRIGPRIGALLLKFSDLKLEDIPDDDSDAAKALQAEDAELRQLLDRACRLILPDAPREVIAGLEHFDKVTIFGFFTDLLTPGLAQSRASQVARQSARSKPSSGSSGSSTATRRRGSRKSRSGSSART